MEPSRKDKDKDMEEVHFYVGQQVAYRDEGGDLHDGWKVNAYNGRDLQYELVKDGKRIWVDDCRVEGI